MVSGGLESSTAGLEGGGELGAGTGAGDGFAGGDAGTAGGAGGGAAGGVTTTAAGGAPASPRVVVLSGSCTRTAGDPVTAGFFGGGSFGGGSFGAPSFPRTGLAGGLTPRAVVSSSRVLARTSAPHPPQKRAPTSTAAPQASHGYTKRAAR